MVAAEAARRGLPCAFQLLVYPVTDFAEKSESRQLFNDAVLACNQAAHQWPTRLLVMLYGFEDTGPL